MMTPEEKSLCEMLPPARIESHAAPYGNPTALALPSGRSDLVIQTQSKGEWGVNRDVSFYFHDPQSLANFINALVCRYNFLVRKTNQTAKDCPLMEKLNESPAPGVTA